MAEHVRTHIAVPEELIRSVDAVVGVRRRSQFFVEAACEKLARLRLLDAAEKAAGSLAAADIPEWASAETTSAWVRDLRRADDERDGESKA